MWENRGIHPLILNIGTGWRWEVSCMPRPLYFQDLCSPYPLIMKLGWRQSQPGRLEEHRTCPAGNWTAIGQLFLSILYMIRYNMMWYDMMWYDIWCDMMWYVIRYDNIWCDDIWYDIMWCDIWYDVMWYNIYDTICYDIRCDMIYDMMWCALFACPYCTTLYLQEHLTGCYLRTLLLQNQ